MRIKYLHNKCVIRGVFLFVPRTRPKTCSTKHASPQCTMHIPQPRTTHNALSNTHVSQPLPWVSVELVDFQPIAKSLLSCTTRLAAQRTTPDNTRRADRRVNHILKRGTGLIKFFGLVSGCAITKPRQRPNLTTEYPISACYRLSPFMIIRELSCQVWSPVLTQLSTFCVSSCIFVSSVLSLG